MAFKDCIKSAVDGGALTQSEADALLARHDVLARTRGIAALAALADELVRKPQAVVTRDEITGYLEQNRIALNEVVRRRDDNGAKVSKRVREKMAEWEDEQYKVARFEPHRNGDAFFESDKALEAGNTFLKKEGFDPDAADGDYYAEAYEKMGVKVTVGRLPLWEDFNGDWFVVEAPNGKAMLMAESGSGPDVHESAAAAIAGLEAEARGNVDLGDTRHIEAEFRSDAESELAGVDDTKWSSYSLDPSNPTYRETVLHLPEVAQDESALGPKGWSDAYNANARAGDVNFRSGHFSEPNIIGHMMTSLTKHEGKAVYTIDQIQSDWGQKLRDGGVRDEAKIAGIRKQLKEANALVVSPASIAWQERVKAFGQEKGLSVGNDPTGYRYNINRLQSRNDAVGAIAKELYASDPARQAVEDVRRLRAELATVENSVAGHPLVNTTDQWTNTTLRRAIRQAVEADADYIAIPSGKTVLSYNPGDDHGMEVFYNDIVPKNLKNLLRKIDKQSPDPVAADKLETPSKGMVGAGFTIFKLTEKVKAAVIEEGQPLFALRDLSTRLRAPLVDDLGKADPHPGRVMAIHGTKAATDFAKFDPAKSSDFGIHFGSRDQADIPAGMTTTRDNARMIPVILDLKQVVDVPDMMTWPPAEVAREVEKAYPSAFGIAARVQAAIDNGPKEIGINGKPRPSAEALAAGKDELRRLMTDAGIDGLRYWNKSEGDGWSYVVWDKDKVQSALTGEPMLAARDDALKLIRSLGGIKDESGDLAHMGVGESTRGIINNTTGIPPDRMREALVEAGYLQDVLPGMETQSTIQDLYDLIDEAIRAPETNRVYREELAHEVIGAARSLMSENGLKIDFTEAQEALLVKWVLDQRMQVDDAVERLGMRGGADDVPERPAGFGDPSIDIAALRFMRELRERAAEAGHGGGDGDGFNPSIADEVWEDGGQTYVTRLYSREKIVKRRPQFKAIITDYFEQAQRRAAAVLSRIEREVAQATQTANSAGKEMKLGKDTAKNIEDLRAFTGLSRQDLDATAGTVIEHILGSPEGRMLYDLPAAVRGPLKARTLRIPDAFESEAGKFEDFLDRNIGTIARFYTRTMVPDIELTRMFGSLDLKDQIGKINDDYQKMADSPELAKLPPEEAGAMRDRLEREKQVAVKDLLAQVDRLRGSYAIPDDPMGWGPRTVRALKTWNLLRMLGGMTVSALPDIFRPMMVHGIGSYFNDGIRPLLSGIRARKLAADEVRLSGTAWDMVLSTRAHSIADVLDDYGRYSRFERGLGWMQDKFGTLTLMNQWNTALKSWAGVVTMNNIIKASRRVADGTASAKDIRKLAASSIDGFDARLIAEQFAKHGVVHDGVYLPNTQQWDATPNIAVARDVFRAAVVRDVDRIVVTPGQDKPLWMSTQMGSLAGQFKTFAFASMQRTLVAGLQQRDAGVVMGIMLTVGMGAVVEYLKSLSNDKPLPKTDAQWIAAAVDRSGLLGWLSEANNMAEKFSGGTLGIGALTGKELSRFASRNVVDSIAGPTAGTITDLAIASAGFSRAALDGEDLRQSDIAALRRLIPLQNLFYLSYIFQKLEQTTSDAVGARPSSRKSSLRDRMSSNDHWLDEFIAA